jgi:nucleoside phosphorylase
VTTSTTTSRNLDEATIGIVTALPKEHAAAMLVFGCDGMPPILAPQSRMNAAYNLCEVTARVGGTHVVAISTLVEMGNDHCAVATTQLLNDCRNVKQVLMVGIAGAVPHPGDPENHVRLGDIVVSSANGVIQFDLGKRQSITKFQYRGTQTRPSPVLLAAVRALESEAELLRFPWEQHIAAATTKNTNFQRPDSSIDVLLDTETPISHPDDSEWRRPSVPRVFLGTIGSSNILLKDAAYRDRLRDKHSIRAVEMESAGLVDATWFQQCGYLIVRGTCDYCNKNKGNKWQRYAAAIAASYARSVIEFVPPLSNHSIPAQVLVPPSFESKVDRLVADVGQLKSLMEKAPQTQSGVDSEILIETVKQLIDRIAGAWKVLETREALNLSSNLEQLVDKHEAVIPPDLVRLAYVTLANAAANEAMLARERKPDMSKAKKFIERGKHVRA